MTGNQKALRDSSLGAFCVWAATELPPLSARSPADAQGVNEAARAFAARAAPSGVPRARSARAAMLFDAPNDADYYCGSVDRGFPVRLVRHHLAAAALRAISRRRSGLSDSARAVAAFAASSASASPSAPPPPWALSRASS
jgi:hypothetical protein